MIKKKTLWKDYLYEDKIKRINLSSIIDFSYEWKSTCPGRVISNNGGWQSHCYLKSGKTCNELDKFISIVEKKFKYQHMRFGKRLFIDALWININGNGSSNRIHDHLGGPFLSGVFYLNAKNNMGNIVFLKTHNISWMTVDDINMYSLELPANTEKMYVFSASLPHFVKENNTMEDRISLSFNMSYLRG